MANICMDTVVFFAASDTQKDGFSRLKKAVADCYPPQITVDDAGLCRIFEQNGIPVDGLCLRSDITDISLEDDHITLYCDSAWNPMYEAYLSLASHFGVCFELEAEESGCGIYINTDINGTYLTPSIRHTFQSARKTLAGYTFRQLAWGYGFLLRFGKSPTPVVQETRRHCCKLRTGTKGYSG